MDASKNSAAQVKRTSSGFLLLRVAQFSNPKPPFSQPIHAPCHRGWNAHLEAEAGDDKNQKSVRVVSRRSGETGALICAFKAIDSLLVHPTTSRPSPVSTSR